jgi:hypothetical protein
VTSTVTAHTEGRAHPPAVCGLRVLGHPHIFWLDAMTKADRRKRSITAGRDTACDIWLSDSTVSARHCTITVAGTAARLGYVLRDCGSKNGTFVSVQGPHGVFTRVRRVRLKVGLHVRLGDVILVAVDRHGTCPLTVRGDDDLIAQAHRLYGSVRAAARFIGLSQGRIRRLLGSASTKDGQP